MGVLCAVFGCGNNASRDKAKSFFRIPKIIRNNDPEKRDENLSRERRKKWLLNISRVDLTEEKAEFTRVCSDHFITGKPASLYDRNNPDWAPTQRMGHNKIKTPKQADLSRSERSQERAAKKVKIEAERRIKAAEKLLEETKEVPVCSENENGTETTRDGATHADVGCQTDLSGLQICEMEDCIKNMTDELVELKKKLMEADFNEESFKVIDLHEVSPESALEFCKLLPEHSCRILVCGGDGSVGWVLAALDKVKLKNSPHIAILPLGTGNDLARVLGWGSGYTGEQDVNDILESLLKAKVMPLDRWDVTVECRSYFGVRKPRKTFMMNNYFSVGCDAKVVLNFHQHRERQPALFSSRIFNKAMYGIYGARDVLEQECKNLHELVKLELDGQVIDLPDLEGIVILNIGSWCGGCELWKDRDNKNEDNMPIPSVNDGKLEVVGLYSSLHIARLQVNLADPLILGQAHSIKLTLQNTKHLPVQVDGEPWEQAPCVITISHHNQALMLSNVTNE